MQNSGLAIRFSGNELFKKFLAAWLIAAMIFSGMPLMTGLGAPLAPSATILVNDPLDIYDTAVACNVLTIAGLPGIGGWTSLREAICAANNDTVGAPHTIDLWQIAAGTVITIGVSGTPLPLPTIVAPMRITGLMGGRVIDGSALAAMGIVANGFTITTTNVTIEGMVIQNFPGNGIEIKGGGGHTIRGNHIGVHIGGLAPKPNMADGIHIRNSIGNVIGGAGWGNVVSWNAGDGIEINGTSAWGNTIIGNMIGVDANGASPGSNSQNGVRIQDSPGNMIGGTNSNEENIISFNLGSGVKISGVNASSNAVIGNLIGVDVGGWRDFGNSNEGILIENAPGNFIGGPTPKGRNVISGNGSHGVKIIGATASGNAIYGNEIGTNITGTVAISNTLCGIFLDGSPNTKIGGINPGEGNLVSGNNAYGILIGGGAASGNVLKQNYIGTNITGSMAIPNQMSGIYISDAPTNTIGGSGLWDWNLISGNLDTGVMITGTQAWDNKVLGNKIGTDYLGSSDLGNMDYGVLISNAPRNAIGGSSLGDGNLISGNDQDGISIYGSGANNNTVEGNFIGTNASGTLALENDSNGIWINDAPRNKIGGASAGSGNLISGNDEHGIYIYNTGSVDNLVMGNIIGLDITTVITMPNELSGIFIRDALSTTVGGTTLGQANIIAGNLRDGVTVDGNSAEANLISTNSIYDNSNLGLDLKDDGVTANDSLDADSGPNGLQNFPLIGMALVPTTTVTAVFGELTSAVSATYRIEFYSSPGCDASGNGEGKTLVGARSVTIDGTGKVIFGFKISYGATVGNFLTALAIDQQGNTSEFSLCRRIDSTVLFLPIIRK